MVLGQPASANIITQAITLLSVKFYVCVKLMTLDLKKKIKRL